MSEQPKENPIETIRDVLMNLADSFNDKAIFARKLANHLELVKLPVLNQFLIEVNELLIFEAKFDSKWIGKFTDTDNVVL